MQVHQTLLYYAMRCVAFHLFVVASQALPPSKM